ncbi:acyl-CoA desaturase, partial [Candidatus Synechococcus spongiarum]
SFRVPRWLRNLLATCGALSCQHGPVTWVGLHRHHHRFSDTHQDHHNSLCGFWWSHMGWMLFATPAMALVPQFTRDLHNDPWLRFLDRWFLALQLPLAMALYLLGERLGVGGWSLVLWGIPLRLVAVYHVTWLVNSATHAWGYRSFATADASRNCWWVALLSFGEGWHNNHHAVPFSARQGLRWFELDLTWQHIRLLQALGLARGVKVALCEQGSSHGQAVSGGA